MVSVLYVVSHCSTEFYSRPAADLRQCTDFYIFHFSCQPFSPRFYHVLPLFFSVGILVRFLLCQFGSHALFRQFFPHTEMFIRYLRTFCAPLLRNPAAVGGINSEIPSAHGSLSFIVVRSLMGAGWLLCKYISHALFFISANSVIVCHSTLLLFPLLVVRRSITCQL